jgi:phosphatidylglycerophosphatase C
MMQNKTLVLFDFDGTITKKDSLSEFFKFIQPNKLKRFSIKYIQTLPFIVLYKMALISTDQLKKARIRAFFKGMNYNDLIIAGRDFADNILPGLVKHSARTAIEKHLVNGDDIFIVSASLDIILTSWCEHYGVGLITNIIDPLSNCYSGIDCNGLEKVNRINQHFDLSKYDLIYAYGDTNGDLPMLNLAHKQFYQYFT